MSSPHNFSDDPNAFPGPQQSSNATVILIARTSSTFSDASAGPVSRSSIPSAYRATSTATTTLTWPICSAFKFASPGRASVPRPFPCSIQWLRRPVTRLFREHWPAAYGMLTDVDPLALRKIPETTTGIDGNTVHVIPHNRFRAVLRKHNRLVGD